MKKKLNQSFLFVFMIFSSFLFSYGDTYSQARELGESYDPPKKNKKKGFDSDRLRYGGGLGASFGDITYVEVSPTVGYLVTDNYLAGIGGRYIYFEDRFFNYKTNIYGGSVFNQYYFLESFLAHAELEVLNLDDRKNLEQRVNVTSIFIGGGYRSMIGETSFASILLLYNINETYNTPYTNPVLRISFGFGL